MITGIESKNRDSPYPLMSLKKKEKIEIYIPMGREGERGKRAGGRAGGGVRGCKITL